MSEFAKSRDMKPVGSHSCNDPDCESVRFSCYVSIHEWNTNITSTYHRTLTVSKTRPTLVVIFKHYTAPRICAIRNDVVDP